MDQPWYRQYHAKTPRTLAYPEASIDSLLDDAARDFPDATAIKFVLKYAAGGRLLIGGTLTYRQFQTAVDRFATALDALGVRKGDRIAVMLPNSPQFAIAFFAAMRLGAIVVNTNPTYTPREIKHQVEDSGAETIIMLNLFLPRLREVQGELPHLKRVIATAVFDTLPFPASALVRRAQKADPAWVDVEPDGMTFSFADLLNDYPPAPPKVERSSNDVALFQYTGGTTGLPKAAMLTHRNILANVLQINAWLPDGTRGNERVMCAIPFFHVYGMTVAMLYTVFMASEMVIVPNPRPIDNVMDVIQKERTTIFPGVPAMYIGIVNHKRIAEYDLKSVRACISGSAPLPMEIQEQFGELTGGRLVEGYGLTEAAPVTHANPIYGTRKAGSIGIPFPDVEAKIVDMETGEEIPPGSDKEGEMFLRGPQVMVGYWNKPEESADTVDADGWLHTGDICKVDEDGYFYIVDRKKDLINASGYKVLPRDVEEVLFSHPKVLEAVVAGVPHPKRGETVKAYIVVKPGEELTVEEILAHCRKNLAPYKVPTAVEFREELPKTIVGKVLRRVLVEEERQKLAGAPA